MHIVYVHRQFRIDIETMHQQYTYGVAQAIYILSAQYGYCSNICNMVAAIPPHSSSTVGRDAINLLLWVTVQFYAISILQVLARKFLSSFAMTITSENPPPAIKTINDPKED